MTETELLPCPFCGGKPVISKHFKDDAWSLSHRCEVVGFIEIGWTAPASRLVKRWNTRKLEQR